MNGKSLVPKTIKLNQIDLTKQEITESIKIGENDEEHAFCHFHAIRTHLKNRGSDNHPTEQLEHVDAKVVFAVELQGDF